MLKNLKKTTYARFYIFNIKKRLRPIIWIK